MAGNDHVIDVCEYGNKFTWRRAKLFGEVDVAKVGVELVNNCTEDNAKDSCGDAFSLKDTLCDEQFSSFVLFAWDEEFSVRMFPKERHDGSKKWRVCNECLQGLVSKDRPEGILMSVAMNT